MIEWLQQLSPARRKLALGEVSNQTGLPVKAIEKDWWVTLALRAVFSTPWAANIVFKGGTSLSKSWALIDRFSEDIDLALDRSVLGFGNITTGTDIKRLRRASADFIANTFTPVLQDTILKMGVDKEMFELVVRPTDQPDIDPQVLELHYKSDLDAGNYILDRVLIEIGSRSLREPCSPRQITSIIGSAMPTRPFAGIPFTVETVEPRRTFLEKIFLLHEMFQQPKEKWRHERLSRHLYDLHQLKNTAHGQSALTDADLYNSIVTHRKTITPIRGVDYALHTPATIQFIPPQPVLTLWEADYKVMRETMIYGNAPNFQALMEALGDLQKHINTITFENNQHINQLPHN